MKASSEEEEVIVVKSAKTRASLPVLYVGKSAKHVNQIFCKLQIEMQNKETMLSLKKLTHNHRNERGKCKAGQG